MPEFAGLVPRTRERARQDSDLASSGFAPARLPAEAAAPRHASDTAGRIRRAANLDTRAQRSDEAVAGRIRRAADIVEQPQRAGASTVDRIQLTDRPTTAHGQRLPEQLRAGVESLSGLSMQDVTVHRDSPRPAQLGALAFAEGSDIHLGPGQEQHLPHEAWHVVQQAQGRVKPSVQAKGWTLINDDRGLEREADVMGGRAARHTTLGGSAERELTASTNRAPTAAIQLKAPAGWKQDDATTWEPDAYGGFSYELVNDALSTLDLDVNRDVADKWATKALDNGLVGLGPVRSTYKSSYDQEANAFSVSQDVPWIDQLVVHAHISPIDVVALDGGVNLKWKHNEIGRKAANVPSSLGSNIIDVAAARAHWESNPEHDRAEEDAEDYATGQAIFELFDTSKQDAIDKAAADAAKKESDTQLVNWGWANVKPEKRKQYGDMLKAARGSAATFEPFLQMIRDAQARKAAKAAAPPI